MSKESRVIRISESIFTRLQSHAEPLVDTPATVIEKLLDYYEEFKKNNRRNKEINLTQENSIIKKINPDYPPDLRYTKPKKIIIDWDKAEDYYDEHEIENWHQIVAIINRIAREEFNSFEALKKLTAFQIKPGIFTNNGFVYDKKWGDEDFPFSIQRVEANKAWLGSLEMAKKLNRKIEIHFKWLDNEKAAFPGEEGILSWSPDENSQPLAWE
ncbi:T4SS efffector SepA family protein [Gloeothece verrucosa]|uniref:Uncharacterized protein n=1 Tax=Gloeothece verrucosa (strain PCC 7822) TaxID=497965 RepID=E0UGY1_GLOV7|nr:hypothetical protein [Gloeothece verrucosa]ADN14462.1 conserved hypothetical protein [Gloeothece verrucosa PCC 7822]